MTNPQISIAEPPQLHFPATKSIHWNCGKCSNPKSWKSRHKKLKTGSKAGHLATSVGITATQQVTTGASAFAAITAGTALSATGIGLIAGSAALSVGKSYTAHRSAKKTQAHLDALSSILRGRNSYQCDAKHGPVHSYIASTILPYIVQQKKTKLARKKNERVPVLGSGYEAGKSLKHMVQKRWNGTKGKQRSFSAQWLAVHLLSHHCDLTEAIVAELYSDEEMEMMKLSGSDIVASMIEDKLKTI